MIKQKKSGSKKAGRNKDKNALYRARLNKILEAARLIEQAVVSNNPGLSPEEVGLVNAGVERAIKRVHMIGGA